MQTYQKQSLGITMPPAQQQQRYHQSDASLSRSKQSPGRTQPCVP
jgi:hypothetical protein